MSINWNELIEQSKESAQDFEPLPNDDYDVEVVGCEAQTSQGGKPMFSLQLAVVGGPYNNRRVWDRLVVSAENPNAMGFFFRKCAALGLDQQFFASNPTPETIANALVGKRARVKLGQREYNGRTSNEVKSYAKPSAEAAGPGPSAAVQAAPATGPAPAPAPSPQPAATPTPQPQAPITTPSPTAEPF